MKQHKTIFADGLNVHKNLNIKTEGFTFMRLVNPSEKWTIRADVRETLNNADRELTEIRVLMPDESTWIGTIQDFMAIKHIAQNALAALQNLSIHTQVTESGETPEITELKQLLSHFS